MNAYSAIGKGVYTVAQASRLTGVAPATVRRWVYGYRYRGGHSWVEQPEVLDHDIPKRPGATALSFLDLVELRFIYEFRNSGLSLTFLRNAKARAIELTESTHPYASNRFWSDGRSLFLKIETERQDFLDVVSNQMAFREIVERGMKNLEFEDDFVSRWWPMGQQKLVVLDPKRAFGQPIESSAGIRTAVLAEALKGQGTIENVADWYDVSVDAVRDSVEFEHQIAA